MAFEVRHLPGDVLGLDAFARATLAGRPHPPTFGGAAGAAVPARTAECPEPPDEPDAALVDRAELADLVRAAHADVEGHPAVAEALERFERPRACCVVAPIAPAYLAGPLASLYAALHAIALARELAHAWSRPVVPLVWLASDGHDLASARGAWLLGRHLDLVHTGLASLGSGTRAIASIHLDETTHRLGATAAHVAQILPEGPQRAAALGLFVPRAGETLADAHRRVLFALLGHHGLLVLEPRHVRAPLARALERCVATADQGLLDDAVAQEPVVFRAVDGRRAPLHLAGAHFLHAGEEAERSGRELAALIAAAPADFVAAPVLEPLVRDLVLPVAATVGDGATARHVAAGLAWRRRVGAPLTPFVPRVEVTLLSPAARTALAKRGVDVELVLRTRGALPAPPSAERPAVLDALRELVRRQTAELKAQRDALAALEKGLAHHLRRAADENADRVEKILERAERVHANRTGTGRRHDRRLANTLAPRGEAQSAVLTTAQYAAAFGTDWIDALLEALDPWPSEHLVLHLDA